MLGAALVLIEPPKVEFHLPFVARFETAKFEIDRDQACESPVIKQQVEVKILITDGHPLLTRQEREVRPEFQEKPLELLQDGRFQVASAERIFQTEKIEQIGIAEDEFGPQPVRLPKLLEIFANGCLGQSGDRGSSNIMLRTRSRCVRTLHRSSRHISA